jgi:hypothetical protein
MFLAPDEVVTPIAESLLAEIDAVRRPLDAELVLCHVFGMVERGIEGDDREREEASRPCWSRSSGTPRLCTARRRSLLREPPPRSDRRRLALRLRPWRSGWRAPGSRSARGLR